MTLLVELFAALVSFVGQSDRSIAPFVTDASQSLTIIVSTLFCRALLFKFSRGKMDFNMAEYKPNVKFLAVIYNLRDQFV